LGADLADLERAEGRGDERRHDGTGRWGGNDGVVFQSVGFLDID
jgi:hypothetical protein